MPTPLTRGLSLSLNRVQSHKLSPDPRRGQDEGFTPESLCPTPI